MKLNEMGDQKCGINIGANVCVLVFCSILLEMMGETWHMDTGSVSLFLNSLDRQFALNRHEIHVGYKLCLCSIH